MRQSIFFVFLLGGLLFYSSCNNDDDSLDSNYQIYLSAPSSVTYFLGDTLPIQVEFQELNGGTIYNVNIRIFNNSDGTEIYNKPDSSNIQIIGGIYSYLDELVLENLDTNGEWILEARVWGEETGDYEIQETMEIQIES